MEPENILLNGFNIRLQIVEIASKEFLEHFIEGHFLHEESAAQAVGLNRSDLETSNERKLIAHKYANLALSSDPIVSFIAFREDQKEVIGMSLCEVVDLNGQKEKKEESYGYCENVTRLVYTGFRDWGSRVESGEYFLYWREQKFPIFSNTKTLKMLKIDDKFIFLTILKEIVRFFEKVYRNFRRK